MAVVNATAADGTLEITGSSGGTRVVNATAAVGSVIIDLAQAGIPGDVVLTASLLDSPFTAELQR